MSIIQMLIFNIEKVRSILKIESFPINVLKYGFFFRFWFVILVDDFFFLLLGFHVYFKQNFHVEYKQICTELYTITILFYNSNLYSL